MKKIKLIAIDLDDTLLTDEKTVSQEDKETLKKLKDKGIKIVIASGRFPETHLAIIKTLGLNLEDQVQIADGGGTIYKGSQREHLGILNRPNYLKVLEALRKKGFHFFVTNGEHVYFEEEGPLLEIYGFLNKINQGLIVKIDDLKEVNDPLKFIIYAPDDKTLKEVENIELNRLKAFRAAKNIAEITSQDLDKWIALEKLLEEYKIKPDEVAAVGDTGNDTLMVKEAGLGMAVGNASKELKKVANVVSEKDNNHSAFSDLVNRYILTKDEF